jgi:hypothetical protein
MCARFTCAVPISPRTAILSRRIPLRPVTSLAQRLYHCQSRSPTHSLFHSISLSFTLFVQPLATASQSSVERDPIRTPCTYARARVHTSRPIYKSSHCVVYHLLRTIVRRADTGPSLFLFICFFSAFHYRFTCSPVRTTTSVRVANRRNAQCAIEPRRQFVFFFLFFLFYPSANRSEPFPLRSVDFLLFFSSTSRFRRITIM